MIHKKVADVVRFAITFTAAIKCLNFQTLKAADFSTAHVRTSNTTSFVENFFTT